MGSGQLSAEVPDAEPPSAELLLYLAEFGSEEGPVDDPIAVSRALERSGDSSQNAAPGEAKPALEAPPPKANSEPLTPESENRSEPLTPQSPTP